MSLKNILVAWVNRDPQPTGFIVERKLEADVAFSEIARLGSDVTNYVDRDLENNGGSVTYAVTCFRDTPYGLFKSPVVTKTIEFVEPPPVILGDTVLRVIADPAAEFFGYGFALDDIGWVPGKAMVDGKYTTDLIASWNAFWVGLALTPEEEELYGGIEIVKGTDNDYYFRNTSTKQHTLTISALDQTSTADFIVTSPNNKNETVEENSEGIWMVLPGA